MLNDFEAKNIQGEYKSIHINNVCKKNSVVYEYGIKMHELTKILLSSRDIDSKDAAHNFLFPSLSKMHNPFLLSDMEIAVLRIIASIESNKAILIAGDYDADGVTATSLLLSFFKEIGADAHYYIPKRSDGYGLGLNAIKVAKDYNIDLIITVDNGITSIDEIEFAKQIGIDVVVTDHHEPQDELPDAYAVVNPKRADSKFPFRELSGVGVAFNLIMALRYKLRKRGYFKNIKEPNLKQYLDLVALGTLADVVPLVDENRIYVKFGLNSYRPAIEELKNVAGINNKLNTHHIGFMLAPRINAAGRLYDASIAVDMFLEDDEDKIREIALRLNEINKERQKLQAEIVDEIEQHIVNNDDLIAVASNTNWHRGVIGVAASSLSHKYSKPVIIISKGQQQAIGSGRSVEGVNLFDLVQKSSSMLERFGGHKMAVGITIKNKHIESFQKKINEIAKDTYGTMKRIKKENVDCEVALRCFNRDLLLELSRLEPYGPANQEPNFIVKDAAIKDVKMIMGKYPRVLVDDGTDRIWMAYFNKDVTIDINRRYSFIFNAKINNGYDSFTIKDILLS